MCWIDNSRGTAFSRGQLIRFLSVSPRRCSIPVGSFLFGLLLTAGGCAGERLAGEQPKAAYQVREWVPEGTSVADAMRIMKEHDFKCGFATNGAPSLECDYESKGTLYSEPVIVVGHASFPVSDGKVGDAQVTTSVKGP